MRKFAPFFLPCFLLFTTGFFYSCDSQPDGDSLAQETTALKTIDQDLIAQNSGMAVPGMPNAELEELRALGYAGDTHEKPAPRQQEAVYSPNLGANAPSYPFVLKDKPVQNLLTGVPNLEDIEIAASTRKSLRLISGNAVVLKGEIKESVSLHFGTGQTYAQIAPHSLILQMDILDSESHLLQQEIVSSIAGAWVDRTISLHPYQGRNVQLVFSVLSLDPSQDRNPIYLSPLLVTNSKKNGTKPPHVFFILVDTLRADALGCYGQKDPVTPNLDRLARKGVLAENMIAQSPHTETSIPSILLGLYPHIHGRMLRYSKHNSGNPLYIDKNALSGQSLSLAEQFQNTGYWTVGLYNNPLISFKYGFHRGFYDYTDYAAGYGLNDPWSRIAFPTAHIGVNETIRFLEKAPKDIPLFVFLHILDPHNPYTPPGDFNLSIKRPAKNIDEAAYLSETAYADEQIGKLVTYLERQEWYSNSIFLVASDHGEEFVNELGRPIGHGRTLFQTLLHVPFLCVYPGKITAGSRISETLETVDIYPTLLELAGLEVPPTHSGESFASLLTVNKAPRKKTDAIAEGIRKGEERKCLIQGQNKLVYFRDSNRTFLYDLQSDPAELHDVAREKPEIVQNMKKRLFERLGMKEPDIRSLTIVNLGQDGWDVVHTFDKDSSLWQPGISDMHLQIQPVPEPVEHVEIWADDHLHGNHNYSLGWRKPSLGEHPVVVESRGETADLFFEQTDQLKDTQLFVRLIDREGRIYLGLCEGQNAVGANRNVKTKYPAVVKWDFEDPEAMNRWRTGEGGSLTQRKMGANTVLQFEANARSGAFRAYNVIPKVPSGRRVCITFELVVESGGVKMELIHPKTARAIAVHAFSTEQSTNHVTQVEAKKMMVYGITGISQNEEELLFLLSNYSPNNTPAQVLLNDITVYLYPEELETVSESTGEERAIDPSF